MPIALKNDEFRKIGTAKDKIAKELGHADVLVKVSDMKKVLAKIYKQLDKYDI